MQTDADFLGLIAADGPGHYCFKVVDRLARFDGGLYGGAAIAVSIAAAELVSERTALWMTTQFVSTAGKDAEVDVVAEVLAGGRRTNQVRVTATAAGGDVVFASLGATGHHKPEGLAGEFEHFPTVSSPDESERWTSPATGMAKAAGVGEIPNAPRSSGFGLAIELREPEMLDHPDPGPGRLCLWVRRRDREPITPAIAAYLADVVPLGIAYALKVVAAGTSLDNTIRIGSFEETEWLLLDLRPHLAVGGYGHGVAHLWTIDGHLLATASQTASMFAFDVSNLPRARTDA
jgi:acyl-CoA thioesterase